jgi:serine protease Do
MIKLLGILFCLTIKASSSFAFFEAEKGFADIVEPLMPAVVNVYSTKYHKKQNHLPHAPMPQFPKGSPFEQFNEFFERFDAPIDEIYSDPKANSLGSGFIIDETGYIVTNHHVIEGADEINVKLGDDELPAKLIGSDQRTDLALIKIESKTKLPFVKFGDSSKARVGDWIIAIGNPFGLGGTVTAGIVSSKGRDINNAGIVDDFIQTDAAINGGNSGGPMFNVHGEVIGVNTAIFSPSGTNIGIGFAIPSTTAQNVIAQLKEHGKVSRGLLNIQIQEVTSEIAEGLGLKESSGALITDVEAGGDGDVAGLRPGDIIVEFNGLQIKNSRKLQIAVAETPINTMAKIIVLRGNKKLELQCLIKDREKKTSSKKIEVDKTNKDSAKPQSFEQQGIVFSKLTPELSERFGIKSTEHGVVITSVQRKNFGFLGLATGDLILSANQQEILSLDDLKKAYKLAKELKRQNIVFLAKRGSATLFVAMPLELEK